MAILNITPDSFSDGGNFLNGEDALSQAESLLSQGADILDVGGESTRPGAPEVSAADEQARVLPVIEACRQRFPKVLLSIDTSKASVAREALHLGAHIVNDVTGLRGDPEMAPLIAKTQAAVVIMHMQGTPRTMQRQPHYDDVVTDVRDFFEERLQFAQMAGIHEDQIIFDPGIGFGKLPEHNLSLLRHLSELTVGNRPLLLGISRKSFLGHLFDLPLPERDEATALISAFSHQSPILLHRVHDVSRTRKALDIAAALRDLRRAR